VVTHPFNYHTPSSADWLLSCRCHLRLLCKYTHNKIVTQQLYILVSTHLAFSTPLAEFKQSICCSRRDKKKQFFLPLQKFPHQLDNTLLLILPTHITPTTVLQPFSCPLMLPQGPLPYTPIAIKSGQKQCFL